MDLHGQVAIVTGAGRLKGLAHGVARGLSREGADIVIADSNHEDLAQARESIESLGRRCVCVATELQNQRSVDAMVQEALRQVGRIDVLVNAPGGSWALPRNDSKPFIGVSNCAPEEWRNIIALNLESPFFAARAVAPYFMEQRSGRIVNFSSTAGRIGIREGYGSSGPYAVASAGIIGLTKQLAQELAPYGVNVNCVAPGVVGSDGAEPAASTDAGLQLVQRIAMGRVAPVEDVAQVVVALCTPETSYMTGVTVDINGGMYNA